MPLLSCLPERLIFIVNSWVTRLTLTAWFSNLNPTFHSKKGLMMRLLWLCIHLSVHRRSSASPKLSLVSCRNWTAAVCGWERTDHETLTDGCSLEGLKAIRDPGTVLMMDLLTINGGRHDISWPLLIIDHHGRSLNRPWYSTARSFLVTLWAR